MMTIEVMVMIVIAMVIIAGIDVVLDRLRARRYAEAQLAARRLFCAVYTYTVEHTVRGGRREELDAILAPIKDVDDTTSTITIAARRAAMEDLHGFSVAVSKATLGAVHNNQVKPTDLN